MSISVILWVWLVTRLESSFVLWSSVINVLNVVFFLSRYSEDFTCRTLSCPESSLEADHIMESGRADRFCGTAGSGADLGVFGMMSSIILTAQLIINIINSSNNNNNNNNDRNNNNNNNNLNDNSMVMVMAMNMNTNAGRRRREAPRTRESDSDACIQRLMCTDIQRLPMIQQKYYEILYEELTLNKSGEVPLVPNICDLSLKESCFGII